MSAPPPSSLSSAATSPLRASLQSLHIHLRTLFLHLKSHVPAGATVAALAFIAGAVAYQLYQRMHRRRWSTGELHLSHCTHTLKRICAQKFDEVDCEKEGVLQAHEARICFAAVLQELNTPTVTAQLARQLTATGPAAATATAATEAPSAVATGSVDASSVASSPSSSAAAALSPSPLSATSEIELEVRTLLSLLWSSLSSQVNELFPWFLDHCARPATPPMSHAPPQQQHSKQSKHRQNRTTAAAADSAASSASAATAAPSSVNAHASAFHPAQLATDSSAAPSSYSSSSASSVAPLSPSHSHTSPNHSHHSSPRTSAAVHPRHEYLLYRSEFIAALTAWLEMQIVRQLSTTDAQS